ncbi:hypothetical protein BCT73_08085 [Vibrio breoganii]|nr:hypothetical protein BCU06_03545 [Vibrio breoganii]PML35658.1 hypothetical protein BCT77_17745 [Vibrio breoganii]PML60375.1 hypothetical protein BCT73_08085 [Vibrio breoganii]PMM87862.1 hypothetical protein BCT45_04640 [Vibrio breoganii]PMO76556.1 hypothetical protein BCT02_01015 [Vibrio breoganii]
MQFIHIFEKLAVSCQLSAVSRKLQVVRVLGDDGLFGACFQKSTQSPEPRAQSPEPRTHSLEPCIPSKIVIICLLKCNLLVMQ